MGITTVHLIAENNSGGRLVGTVTASGNGNHCFAALTLPSDMQSSHHGSSAEVKLMMHVSVMMLSYSALMVWSLLAITFF